MPFVIFGGLLINLDEIPGYFIWFSVFSFVQYGEPPKKRNRRPLYDSASCPIRSVGYRIESFHTWEKISDPIPTWHDLQ